MSIKSVDFLLSFRKKCGTLIQRADGKSYCKPIEYKTDGKVFLNHKYDSPVVDL